MLLGCHLVKAGKGMDARNRESGEVWLGKAELSFSPTHQQPLTAGGNQEKSSALHSLSEILCRAAGC